jgi:YtkA-like
MQSRLASLMLFGLLCFALACQSTANMPEQPIKSTKAGELTVTLSSPGGKLKNGDNDLMLSFSDASGNPVEVGAASLNFHMGAMGSMAEMNDRATLTTTTVPGKYRAQVKLSMGGSWEAQVAYQGTNGTGKASMNVQAK